MATRRHIVTSLTGFIAVSTGCLESVSEGPKPEASATKTVAEKRFTQLEEEPAHIEARLSDLKPVGTTNKITPADGWVPSNWSINKQEHLEGVDIDNTIDNSEEVNKFLTDIGFSEYSLLVHQYPILSCRSRNLETLQWGDPAEQGTPIKLNYSLSKRECNTSSEEHVEMTIVRVPANIPFVGYFSSMVTK
ncbi:hypothetical protein [Halorubellus litoreus]|uniref:PASTA domain-containing protein n=1 Tax=Halorubellus litoreus TaxID=755308 RepID=A0ABD5VN60_9EURY